jgi:peroxiredoxin/dTDP-4-amino-4,6-dideoxygalactose transaminase
MKRTWITPWAPLRPDAWLRRPVRDLPFPLGDERGRIYEFARQGLWHGLQTLDLQPGAEILVPAYNHGSELEVIERAGLTLRFYGEGGALAPDEDELDVLVGPETRALYLIHYLGRAQDSAHWRKWCDDRGLLLIEDVAMAWLAERDGVPAGAQADLAIYSPWKTFGLYDVGAMICARPPAPVPTTRRTHARFVLKSHLRWVAGRSALVGDVVRRRRAENPGRLTLPDDEWGLLDPDAGPAALSLFLLRRLARGADAAAARRSNFERLHKRLEEWVAPGFEGIDDESCPFAFPIATADKHGLIAALASEGIEALDLWSLPHPSAPDFPAVLTRRATTIGLPVHQELRDGDLDRIADAVVAYLRGGWRPESSQPTPGEPAPTFELSDQDGERVSLGAHAGKNVVLYFYPEADTPGCTAQACALRDARSGFRDENAVVLGVSPDSQEKLHAFANEYGLPFTLLSDDGHRVADAYGVWRGEENERTTFLIGPDGRVRRVFRNVDPEHHDALVLAELRTARALV